MEEKYRNTFKEINSAKIHCIVPVLIADRKNCQCWTITTDLTEKINNKFDYYYLNEPFIHGSIGNLVSLRFFLKKNECFVFVILNVRSEVDQVLFVVTGNTRMFVQRWKHPIVRVNCKH